MNEKAQSLFRSLARRVPFAHPDDYSFRERKLIQRELIARGLGQGGGRPGPAPERVSPPPATLALALVLGLVFAPALCSVTHSAGKRSGRDLEAEARRADGRP